MENFKETKTKIYLKEYGKIKKGKRLKWINRIRIRKGKGKILKIIVFYKDSFLGIIKYLCNFI